MDKRRNCREMKRAERQQTTFFEEIKRDEIILSSKMYYVSFFSGSALCKTSNSLKKLYKKVKRQREIMFNRRRGQDFQRINLGVLFFFSCHQDPFA